MQVVVPVFHVTPHIPPSSDHVLVPIAAVVMMWLIVVCSAVVVTFHQVVTGQAMVVVILHWRSRRRWRWSVVVHAAAGESQRLEHEQQDIPSSRAHDNSSPGACI